MKTRHTKAVIEWKLIDWLTDWLIDDHSTMPWTFIRGHVQSYHARDSTGSHDYWTRSVVDQGRLFFLIPSEVQVVMTTGPDLIPSEVLWGCCRTLRVALRVALRVTCWLAHMSWPGLLPKPWHLSSSLSAGGCVCVCARGSHLEFTHWTDGNRLSQSVCVRTVSEVCKMWTDCELTSVKGVLLSAISIFFFCLKQAALSLKILVTFNMFGLGWNDRLLYHLDRFPLPGQNGVWHRSICSDMFSSLVRNGSQFVAKQEVSLEIIPDQRSPIQHLHGDGLGWVWNLGIAIPMWQSGTKHPSTP